MMRLEIKAILATWAASKPSVCVVCIFGSYACGEAHAKSGLDIALEFLNVDEPLAKLIENAAAWKIKLAALTGIIVEHLLLSTDDVVRSGAIIKIYSRNT